MKLAYLAANILAARQSISQGAIPRIRAKLFAQQRAVLDDLSDFAAIVCSRQAGKSFTCASNLITQCLAFPESNCAYLALTRKSAKMIIWRTLKKMCKEYNISADFSETELSVTFANGSVIYCLGANDANAAETLRGLPWDLVYIDECASYRGIDYLIEEVIIPAFITKNGKLRLIGTPSGDLNSYFAKAFLEKPEFNKHHWTTVNNTSIPNAAAYIEKIKKAKGYSDDDPVFLREWCGKFVRNIDEQVYKYNPLRNHAIELPEGDWHYVLSVDFGHNDCNAYLVLAYNPEISRKVYVVEQFAKSKMLITDFGRKLKGVVDKYKPVAQVADCGALGKSIAEDINSRFAGVNLKPADKMGKVGHIKLVNAALQDGDIQLLDDEYSILSKEMLELVWKDDEHTMEHPKYPNHCCDCLCYGFTECYSYLSETIEIERQILLEHRKQNEVKGRWFGDKSKEDLGDDNQASEVEELDRWW